MPADEKTLVKYAVDLIMCIDGTGSMGHLIDEVKDSALKFYSMLEAKMSEKKKKIDQLRVKVIVFRDYWADSADMVMQQSKFYDLRTESSEFSCFVSAIKANGGGDAPENGLEALGLALISDWEKSQSYAKQRHVVILYTDDCAHSLEKSPKPSNYPTTIPKTFDDLTDYWMTNFSESAKRLLLFAPDSYPWSQISSSWDNTIHYTSKAGNGLQEVEMNDILDVIANSL